MTYPNLTVQQLSPARIESPLPADQRLHGWQFDFVNEAGRVLFGILTDTPAEATPSFIRARRTPPVDLF